MHEKTWINRFSGLFMTFQTLRAGNDRVGAFHLPGSFRWLDFGFAIRSAGSGPCTGVPPLRARGLRLYHSA